MRRELWRQRLWVWVPAAVFFALNLGVLLVYRFGYGDRVSSLQEELRAQRGAEKSAEGDRHHLEGLLQQVMLNRKRVESLYADSFSTRKRRLTNATAEVESLATKAGLQPRAFTYPEQEIQSYGLVKRSFIFSVNGNYVQLRQFVNFLELSDSFLTLEEVAAVRGARDQVRRAGGGATRANLYFPHAEQGLPPGPPAPSAGPGAIPNNDPQLSLSLTLSTLFAKDSKSLDPPSDPRRPS